MRLNGVGRMKNSEQAVKRILRPPSVANWVSHNHRRLDKTKNGLLRFAQVPPKHSLGGVYSICEAIVTDRISFEQAMKCVDGIRHPLTRAAAREIIPVFYSYAQSSHLDGLPTFKDFRSPYPIGRTIDGSTITVPVVPTFTILSEGKPTPVFMIGWASRQLTSYQKRLLSTVVHNAILTQQDFMGSNALIVRTPRSKLTNTRIINDWWVRDFPFLTDHELHDQFQRYGQAVTEVVRTLRGE
ncbi:hypothetical protein sphantq_01156 [Sphingobium sp. AntQ-1]|nr:hypothetical protein sphantq_01156 [Sphingobium sp. AntQ-1]